MEFFKRFQEYATCDSDSSSELIVDASLTQPDDYWKNMWLYIAGDSDSTPNVDNVRLIDHFDASLNKLFLEYPLAGSPSIATQYEIHNIFSTFELHDAINEAIHCGFPEFFDVVTDETLIYKADTLEYDLSGLNTAPWIIKAVYLEQPEKSQTGTVTAFTVTSLSDSTASFSEVSAGWIISIYDGTGAGQQRVVSSVSGIQINVSVAWTTNPDTTSKYRVWDPNEQYKSWYRIISWDLDAEEYPSILYFAHRYVSLYGARIRIVYAAEPSELSIDSATTVVPKEYVISKAIEILATRRISTNSADRSKYTSMEQLYRIKADDYKNRNSFRMGSIHMRIRGSDGSPLSTSLEDPLWK
jgi:hypothetical protein